MTLTEAEIRELDGPELSAAVAEAMGWPCEYDDDLGECWVREESDGPIPVIFWHPHEDANQALEVWARMPAGPRHEYEFTMGAEGWVGVYKIVYKGPHRTEYEVHAGETLCVTICRGCLLAMLEASDVRGD